MKPCKFCNGSGQQIDQAALGDQLRQLRIGSRLSLRDMAKLMDVSAPYLSDLERGQRQWHTERIAQFKLSCSNNKTTKGKK